MFQGLPGRACDIITYCLGDNNTDVPGRVDHWIIVGHHSVHMNKVLEGYEDVLCGSLEAKCDHLKKRIADDLVLADLH